jgi:hypothetical protein
VNGNRRRRDRTPFNVYVYHQQRSYVYCAKLGLIRPIQHANLPLNHGPLSSLLRMAVAATMHVAPV